MHRSLRQHLFARSLPLRAQATRAGFARSVSAGAKSQSGAPLSGSRCTAVLRGAHRPSASLRVVGSFASLTSDPLRPAPRPASAGSLSLASLRSRPPRGVGSRPCGLRPWASGFALGGGVLRVQPCIFIETAHLGRARATCATAPKRSPVRADCRANSWLRHSNSALHPPALVARGRGKAHHGAGRASALPLRHSRHVFIDTPKKTAYCVDCSQREKPHRCQSVGFL